MKRDERGSASASATRAYRAPRLKRVALVPEEATLVACKTTSVGGPGGASWKCVSQKIECARQLS